MPDTVVREAAFTSTSATAETAFGGRVAFIIESSTGKDISAASQSPHEAEVLFDRGTQFYVRSNAVGPASGLHTVVMREVTP